MSRVLFLLLPALVLQAQDSAIPGAREVRPGIFVLRGVPGEDTCAAIKRQHVTHVIDLRRDGEANLNCENEASRMQDMGIQYVRYAVSRTPPAGDFDFLRAFLRDLPKGSKVLIHCGDGNRAAAMVCPWLVLDKGIPIEEAFRIAKGAGLQLPETENAVRMYLTGRGRA
jgi:protein tyrosine phosphatase (PTP) superfamily phosphohydrolase (DUF442 family)